MSYISQIAGNKVVHSNYMKAFIYKPVAKMRPKKTCCASNEDSAGVHIHPLVSELDDVDLKMSR